MGSRSIEANDIKPTALIAIPTTGIILRFIESARVPRRAFANRRASGRYRPITMNPINEISHNSGAIHVCG